VLVLGHVAALVVTQRGVGVNHTCAAEQRVEEGLKGHWCEAMGEWDNGPKT